MQATTEPAWKKQLRDKIEAGYWRKIQEEVMGPIVEVLLDEAFYDLPPGFVKPKSYPGFKSALKGYVDLGLIDPKSKNLKGDAKLKAQVLRTVVKLLLASKGDNAFIRDPEAVMPILFGHIKVRLKSDLEEALHAMYDEPVAVTVAGVKTKKGVPGWRIHAKGLSKHVPDA